MLIGKKKRTGYFICITGIDGSGKTTLAKRTIKLFEDKLTIKYVYCGWRQFDSFVFSPLVKITKLVAKKSYNSEVFDMEGKKHYNKKVLKLFVMADYYIIMITRLIIPLISGANIISDRYFYDVFINTGLDLNESNQEIRRSINKWKSWFPKPDIIFLLDVPVNIAYGRKDDIPFENYLSEHRSIFQTISQDLDFVSLDGSLPLQTLERSIKCKINEILGCVG